MQNNTLTITELQELSSQIPEKISYLKMLVLFGSRATGNINANSDWDFAVLYDEEKRQNYIANNIAVLFELALNLSVLYSINNPTRGL